MANSATSWPFTTIVTSQRGAEPSGAYGRPRSVSRRAHAVGHAVWHGYLDTIDVSEFPRHEVGITAVARPGKQT